MAAGRGTRMRTMTDHIPKPMIRYGEYTLIENGIRKLIQHVDHIHITVGYKGALLAEHVIGLGVDTVINTEGKGNAWWIYNSLMSQLEGPVVVLTADNVTDLDFDLLEKEYEKFNAPACMVIPVLPVPGLEGDYIHHDKNKVIELNRNKPSDMYCSGIQIVDLKKINKLTRPVQDFYEVWQQLILSSQLYCSNVYPKNWFTVDTPEQLDQLNKSTDLA